ncbi:hypothetical protein CALCODRAFT_550484 [Calocera cornea HHB12733]|uniref:Multiple myeloma tumor-associated protein 2-like N-terminal domain-containing protein n=1 Tax=Calocera cornea HHB12733 TaxID=1353952 RepID=A0A165FWS7_9BASI|nr:hypothetical protein CALCODRAFT_550484 [Calocera cornea HHB12733]
MYNGPIRGGTRGGAGDFKWTDVVQDKDRENYLGHSVNAPAGRWQKNKDIHWYSRDIDRTEEEKREEIRRIKEAEEDALAIALGFQPAVRVPQVESGSVPPGMPDLNDQKAQEKEEKRRRKDEKRVRKEERRVRKEERRREKAMREGRSLSPRRHSDDSRSPSPRRRRNDRSVSPAPRRELDAKPERDGRRTPPRRHDRSPVRDHDRTSSAHRAEGGRGYDEEEMRKERERDRRRWEANAERDRPGRRGGDFWERGQVSTPRR